MTERATGWAHRQVVGGDQRAAAPYQDAAAKLLGYVKQDAANLGLQTHKLTRRLPDGAVITAELRGGIPRTTIQPPPEAAPPAPRSTPDDFVVWARDDAQPDGIDAENPQQILRTAWRTFFFDSDVDGFEDFNGNRGTYIGVFPEGVRRAGNVDWRARDGSRLNWYGPSTRYWMDPYVQPSAQYGKFVFQLGLPVLDVDAYLDALGPGSQDPGFQERWVLGAARRGVWLYVIHTLVYQFATAPASFPRSQGVITDPVQAAVESDVVLSRFLLQGEPPFLTVIGDSRQELWRQARPYPMQPWFFNESCTQAVCHALPATAVFSPNLEGTGFPDIFPPATSHDFLTLTIPDNDAVAPTLFSQPITLSNAPNDSAAIASDFQGDVRRDVSIAVGLQRSFALEPTPTLKVPVLVVGDVPHYLYEPMYRQREFPETGYVTRHVAHVDARLQVAVFMRTSDWLTNLNPERVSAVIEVWRGAAREAEKPIALNPADTGDVAFYSLGIPSAYQTNSNSAGMQLMGWSSFCPSLVLFGVFAEVYRQEFGTVFFYPVFCGAHLAYKFLVRPGSETFGLHKSGDRFPLPLDALDPATLIPDLSKNGPACEQLDVDLHRSVLGCAANKDVVLLSLSMPQDTAALAAPFAVHHVTGSDLPTLTGVDGDNARFHPIWLLGKPPQAAA